MRHRVAHRKLGRVTEHRIAMLRNLATALLEHEHIETTVPRAKELRPYVEHLITAGEERRGRGRHRPAGAARPPSRRARHRRQGRAQEAVRHARAAVQRAPGRLRADPARRATATGDSAEIALVELVGQRIQRQEGGGRQGQESGARASPRDSAAGCGDGGTCPRPQGERRRRRLDARAHEGRQAARHTRAPHRPQRQGRLDRNERRQLPGLADSSAGPVFLYGA